MSNEIKLICCGTTRQTGKDTLCQLFSELNPNIKRVSLADELRAQVNHLAVKFFNKPIAKLNGGEKELFRPILIEVARLARSIDIDCWCKELYQQIEIYDSLAKYKDSIYFLTDLRYENEYRFFKNIYGNSMFFINISRNGAPEPTAEEIKYGPEVAKLADLQLSWHTDQTLNSLRPIAKDLYSKIFKK
jgi:hypothetical protein